MFIYISNNIVGFIDLADERSVAVRTQQHATFLHGQTQLLAIFPLRQAEPVPVGAVFNTTDGNRFALIE